MLRCDSSCERSCAYKADVSANLAEQQQRTDSRGSTSSTLLLMDLQSLHTED
jgi:hypothetical protein